MSLFYITTLRKVKVFVVEREYEHNGHHDILVSKDEWLSLLPDVIAVHGMIIY